MARKEKLKAQLRAPSSKESAAVAECIAKRKFITNFRRGISSKASKPRVQIGPWSSEDCAPFFTDNLPADASPIKFQIQVIKISDENQLTSVEVTQDPSFEISDDAQADTSVPPLSPGACGASGLSLKLKKIGSSWKPVAEAEVLSSSDAEYGEDNGGTEGEEASSGRSAPKKKKHKHHREADDNTSDEERKLLKKRKKLLKRLKKSLKRQEELERAVEQSK